MFVQVGVLYAEMCRTSSDDVMSVVGMRFRRNQCGGFIALGCGFARVTLGIRRVQD